MNGFSVTIVLQKNFMDLQSSSDPELEELFVRRLRLARYDNVLYETMESREIVPWYRRFRKAGVDNGLHD
jgi:hypothetical protein